MFSLGKKKVPTKKGRGKKGAAKKHPARGRSTSKRKSARGKAKRQPSWILDTRRRITGWRDLYEERALIFQFVGLAALTVTLYVFWAVGIFSATNSYVSDQSKRAFTTVGLSIQQVHVEGRNQTELVAVKTALGITPGESILHYDMQAARARLETLDWIETAQIIRFLPGTIHVVLVERNPVALWQINRQHYLIDRTGFVIGSLEGDEYLNLPLVVGPGAAERASEILVALNRRPELRQMVQSSIRVGNRRWNLRLKNGLEVRLPAEDMGAAMDRVLTWDKEHELLSSAYARRVSAIDMRLKDRAFLKLKDEAEMQRWRPGSDA